MSVASLDLLTFVALSCGVHADAVQSQVDDTRRVIMQMSSDEETLTELEGRLRELLAKQRRVHRLNNALSHSRAQREGSPRGTDRPHHSRTPHRSTPSARTPSKDSVASTRADIRRLSRSDAVAVQSRLPDTGDTGSTAALSRTSSTHLHGLSAAEVVRISSLAVGADEASTGGTAGGDPVATDIDSLDAETDAVKEALRRLESQSVKSKLLRLEAHKKATATVDMRQVLQRLVTPFHFSPAVEQLWSAAPVARTPGLTRGTRQDSPSKPRASRRGSVLAPAMTEDQPPVVNASTVLGLVSRASQRLAGRCIDAFDALASTNLGEESSPEQVLDCLLYACSLDPERDDLVMLTGSDDGNGGGETPAVSAAQDIQGALGLERMYLRDGDTGTTTADDSPPFEAAMATYAAERFADASGSTMPVDGAGALPGQPVASSVLSCQDFCALPLDWPGTHTLADVSMSALLPPARHLLTPRFSFADAAELKRLDTVRMQLQRAIVRAAVDMEAICRGVADAMPEYLGPRDVAVLRARLGAARNGNNADDGQWRRWQTIVREAAPPT